jgi:hypothetical protein
MYVYQTPTTKLTFPTAPIPLHGTSVAKIRQCTLLYCSLFQQEAIDDNENTDCSPRHKTRIAKTDFRM